MSQTCVRFSSTGQRSPTCWLTLALCASPAIFGRSTDTPRARLIINVRQSALEPLSLAVTDWCPAIPLHASARVSTNSNLLDSNIAPKRVGGPPQSRCRWSCASSRQFSTSSRARFWKAIASEKGWPSCTQATPWQLIAQKVPPLSIPPLGGSQVHRSRVPANLTSNGDWPALSHATLA